MNSIDVNSNKSFYFLLLAPVLFFVLLFPTCLEAQIFTDDGTPVSPETPQLREKLRYQKNEHVKDTTWSHELSYSLDPENELRLLVPIGRREVQFTDKSGREHSNIITGPGDLSLHWQHSLWQSDWVMGSNRLALNLSLEAPTGEDDRTEDGVEIPRRLQLGTGDWTTTVGGVYTRVDDRQRFSLQGTFNHNTRHDGIRMGEEIDLDLAYWYRLSPGKFRSDKEQPEYRGVLEINSTYRFESEQDGIHSGDDGVNIWLSPGIQFYASPEIQLESAVQVPVVTGIDDALGNRRYAVQFNVKVLF